MFIMQNIVIAEGRLLLQQTGDYTKSAQVCAKSAQQRIRSAQRCRSLWRKMTMAPRIEKMQSPDGEQYRCQPGRQMTPGQQQGNQPKSPAYRTGHCGGQPQNPANKVTMRTYRGPGEVHTEAYRDGKLIWTLTGYGMGNPYASTPLRCPPRFCPSPRRKPKKNDAKGRNTKGLEGCL
jgi:hypothetical protein